ncbi:MAG: DUF11 domain-containing protein [Oscillospiraceae bacterium]|nr:DUF11 domain-containing protein [Oscillospiraceae bacterium]
MENNPKFAARAEKPVLPEGMTDRQRAVVETALAYYYRGEAMQYDSAVLTIQEKYVGDGAVMRETDYTAPEQATRNDRLFTVCSGYCFEVYYNAFGYRLLGDPLENKSFRMVELPADDPVVAFRHEDEGDATDTQLREDDLKKVRAMLQPGDLIVGKKKTGHVMLYVGGAFGDGVDYVLHCWGKKYDMEKGEDKRESDRIRGTGGAIRRDPVEKILFSTDKPWPLPKCNMFAVLRPLDVLADAPLSPAAQMRLLYPRLDLDRCCTHDRFLDAANGEEITVTLDVTNNNTSAYTEPLTVTQTIPPYCELKRGSVAGGGRGDGNAVSWTVPPLAAGQRVKLSYTVTVTGRRGGEITLGGGSAGTIPLTPLAVRIGGRHLTEAQRLALGELQEGRTIGAAGADFAKKFYEAYLDLSPEIPTLAELEKSCFERREIVGAPKAMLCPTETHGMLIPGWIGGMEVWTKNSKDRILEPDAAHLLPGDVILCADDMPAKMGLPDCMIYLGEDCFAYPDETGTVRIGAGLSERLFPTRLFCALRPTLAYDDIALEAPFDPADDEAALKAIAESPDAEELRAALNKKKTARKKQAKAEADRLARAEYDERVRGVVETALAFWRRGERQQYDSVPLNDAETRWGGIGVRRATDHVSPEDATFDTPSFFVCSTFAYNVYYEALGYRIGKSEDDTSCRCLHLTGDKSVVYRYLANAGQTVEEAVADVRRILRPGDVLVGTKSSAHAMVYLGRCLDDGVDYIAHSWGRKYNMTTGKEAHEDRGTVTLQPVEELCFRQGHDAWYKKTKTPRWCLALCHEITILRPLRVTSEADYPLTPNARARLAHPGLDVDRTADFAFFRTLPRGGEITYTVTVKNCSVSDYTAIPVTELVPENATLVRADGAAVTGGKVQWLLDLPAGESRSVSYTVKADRGDSVVSEGGDAAGLRSNRIVTHLTGAGLTEKETAILAETADRCDRTFEAQGTAFAREAYRTLLGKDLPLPDTAALLDAMFTLHRDDPGANTPTVHWRSELPAAAKLLVPRWQGGQWLITKTAAERVLDPRLCDLYPGDVLLTAKKPLTEEMTAQVYLYLGGGAYLTPAGVTREDLIEPLLAQDLFLLFRPAMGE